MRTIFRRRLVMACLVSAAVLPAAGWAPLAANAATGDVTLFDAKGASPFDITNGPDGNLWFTAPAQQEIGQITTTGTVNTFPTGGVTPNGITTGPDGNLWFTAPGNDTIGQITTTGTVLNLFPTGGTQPVDITTGPDGNLWFTAPSQQDIGQITTKGVVKTFPADGVPGGNPLAVHDITAGPDGNVWYGLTGNGLIGQITPSGVVTTFSAGGTQPNTITAGPDGNLWFGAASQEMIGRITTSGSLTLFQDGGIQPAGITAGFGRSPYLFYSGPSQNLVGRISTSGTVTTFPAGVTQPSAVTTQPEGITAGSDGNIWYAAQSQQLIGRVSTPQQLGMFQRQPDGSWTFENISAVAAAPQLQGRPVPVVDGHGVVHVYARTANNHLVEFTQGGGGSFSLFDISAFVGNVPITSEPSPITLNGSAGVDIQVFATSSSGQLLSFVEGNTNPGNWAVFNISSFSGSTATIGKPTVDQFGNDLHVYATDTGHHLHDFVKAPTTNWQDMDLSSAVNPSNPVLALGDAQPYNYGGNSIQTAVTSAPASGASHVLTFVEGVNPDGSLTGLFQVFDVTVAAGQDNSNGDPVPQTAPRPLVFGSNNPPNVGIFVEDRAGLPVEYFKQPSPSQWMVVDVASVAGSGPAPLQTPAGLFVYRVDSSGHLFQYSNSVAGAGSPNWSVFDVTNGAGGILPWFTDPAPISANNQIEVFDLF
jgi:streptogramin lyase